MKRWVIGSEGAPSLSWNMNRGRGIAGLGELTVDAAQTLRQQADALYDVLDRITVSINAGAVSGALEASYVHGFQDARDALRQQLDEHVASLETLEVGATEVWTTGLRQIESDIVSVAHSVESASVRAPVQRGWGLGIWLGVAVVGAVGVGFTIRYFSRRHRG